MKQDIKLQKLQELRELRERRSRGSLMQAHSSERARRKDHSNAKSEHLEVCRTTDLAMQKALKNAETVRDPAARFTSIAVTMRQGREAVDTALDNILVCEEKIHEAEETVKASREDYKSKTRETLRLDKLTEKIATEIHRSEALVEEDELAELFQKKSRVS